MPDLQRLSRRQILTSAPAAAATLLVLPRAGFAQSSTAKAQADSSESDRIAAEFLAGATPEAGGLVFDLPALGDNPAAVPLRITFAQEPDDSLWCEELILLAERNPMPLVSRFRFSALSGTTEIASRIRLIETMPLRALARMSDGRFFDIRQEVTVASGGCSL